MKPILCNHPVRITNGGRFAIAKTASIENPCGEPAVRVFRGIHVRDDGSLYLQPWAGRCRKHDWRGWADTMKEEFPELASKQIEAVVS